MTDTIDHATLKTDILEASVRMQSALVASLKKRINEARAATCDKVDRHTLNQDLLAEINILNNEIELAVLELNEMRRIDCSAFHSRAEYGAVVETDKGCYFISAGIKDFSAAGGNYCGISVYSPMYAAMKGKRAGESFRSGNVQYKIESIF